MNATISWLFKQPRSIKRLISLVLDTVFVSFSFWLAFALRLDSLDLIYSSAHWWMLACMLPITLFCFVRLGLYRAVLRYMAPQAMITMATGIAISAVIMMITAKLFDAFMPRSVPVIYVAVAFILCGRARSLARALYHQNIKRHKTPVIIYGAGSSGRQLNTSLHLGNEYRVMAFVDDNPVLHGLVLQGTKVYPAEQLFELVDHFNVRKLLLAMPSISRQQRREIIERLDTLKLDVLLIPGSADIVSGRAKLTQLHGVNVEDLLGRDPVKPIDELIAANIKNKVVMVTGAGGSIGSELCRQIVQQCPRILVLLEMSEYALYQIDQELSRICNESGYSVRIVPIMASVQQQTRLEAIMRAFKVQTVYHAAAYKHVPMVEYNVVEGVLNNVFGTWHAGEAAINCGVETFVLISTDKAVRPTNIMGTSKRVAELVLQGLALRQNSTRFSMVRFGNVLGSSGSVVPLFKRQIQTGGPVTLTHPDITRYFMTIPEAAQLVIQAGAMGKGGDVFVLDMGEPVRIIDLAHRMIRLMGFEVKNADNPNGDIPIQITGLRPGEKLYEELLIGGDEQLTLHPRIRTAHEIYLLWPQVSDLLDKLNIACETYDQARIRELLLIAPTAFNPQNGICDLVWAECNESAPKAKVAKPIVTESGIPSFTELNKAAEQV